MYQEIQLPKITGSVIKDCMNEIPIEVDREYITQFIMNGQEKVREIIVENEVFSENKNTLQGLMF